MDVNKDIGTENVNPISSDSKARSDSGIPQSSTNDNFPYISPTPGEIPIIAQDPIPGSFHNALKCVPDTPEDKDTACRHYHDVFKEIIQSVKKCGFNAMITGGSFEVMDKMLDTAAELGIKTILISGYFHDKSDNILNSSIDRYKNRKIRPAAFEIMDEPHYYDWGDAFYKEMETKDDGTEVPVERTFNNLTLGHRLLTTYIPDIMSYFNLAAPERKKDVSLPKGWIGTSGTYENYLNVLQNLYRPGVWSYDLYPFRINNGLQEMSVANPETDPPADTETLYEHFYSHLETFSAQAKKTGRPFWAYCMCEGHGEHKYNNEAKKFYPQWFMPVPTEGMLRFEAFSALAYGAQGIVYWQYGKGYSEVQKLHRENPDVDVENDIEGFIYEDAPLSITKPDGSEEYVKGEGEDYKFPLDQIVLHYGEGKPIWKAVRQVNAEIKAFSDVFLRCKLLYAAHVGQIYEGAPQLSGKVAGVEIVKTGEKGVLVTHLGNPLHEFVVIVNHDPFYPQEVRCTLNNIRKHTVRMFGIADESLTPRLSEPKSFTRNLAPGGCVIIQTKKS